MSEDSTPVGETDDLDAFEKDFYGSSEATVQEDPAEEVSEEEPDNLGEIDPPATEDDDNEEESEEPVEDEDEDEEPEEEPKPKPKKQSIQERINELTAEKHEERRMRLALEKRLEKLEAEAPVEKEEKVILRDVLPDDAPNPDKLGEDGEPLYPLGEFDPLYIRDLTKFTIKVETERAKEEARIEAAQEAMKAELAEAQTTWLGRLDSFNEEVPEARGAIQELVASFDDVPENYGQYLATVIMSSEMGPQILYHLSQNPGEAQKIVASGPAAATLAFGRLEAKLAKQEAAEAPEKEVKRNKQSAAPTPPDVRVRGSGSKNVVPADTEDLDAFERAFFK